MSSGKSVYGDVSNVYIRKEAVSDDMCRVLCISEGKSRKEKSIFENKGNPFLLDIEGFNNSNQKGNIKNTEKISNKLQRIIGRHGKLSNNYEVSHGVGDYPSKSELLIINKCQKLRC